MEGVSVNDISVYENFGNLPEEAGTCNRVDGDAICAFKIWLKDNKFTELESRDCALVLICFLNHVLRVLELFMYAIMFLCIMSLATSNCGLHGNIQDKQGKRETSGQSLLCLNLSTFRFFFVCVCGLFSK